MVKKKKQAASKMLAAEVSRAAANPNTETDSNDGASCPSLASSSTSGDERDVPDADDAGSCPSLSCDEESGSGSDIPALVSDKDDSDSDGEETAAKSEAAKVAPKATGEAASAPAPRPSTHVLALGSSREAVQALLQEIFLERYSGEAPKEYKLQVQMPATPVNWDNPSQALRDLVRDVAEVKRAMGRGMVRAPSCSCSAALLPSCPHPSRKLLQQRCWSRKLN